MAQRTYGEIPANPPGTTYADRKEAWAKGVHRETQGGISGDKTGSESIVVSGGYPDDEDFGDVIVYTGQGGRDQNSGKQIADQELTNRNLGLARCHAEGLPVRVIRGAQGDPKHSPKTGYRYDGLYQVSDYWQTNGQDGFKIWQFRLVKAGAGDDVDIETWGQAPRVETTVQRIVRSTMQAAKVKSWHDHKCQVCGLRLLTSSGPYAEATHIRGLGAPHHGPDRTDNILCLCPNHHVQFDNGGIYIDAQGAIRDVATQMVIAQLHIAPEHPIDFAHIAYHRDHYRA